MVAITAEDKLTNYISVKDYGAQCNAQHIIGTGTTSASSAIFTDSTASFASTDVGKLFYVAGAGANGTLLSTTILSVQSATSITLNATASVTTTTAEYIYGTDDSAAWNTAVNSIQNNANCTIIVPYGLSLTNGIAVKNNTSISGFQSDGWAFQNPTRASGILLKPQFNGPAQIYGTNSSVGNVRITNLLMDGAFNFQGNTVYRYSGGSISVGTNTFTDSTNGNFTNADLGKKIIIYGAGPAGSGGVNAFFCSTIQSVTNSTTVVLEAQHPVATTVSNAAYAYGFSTQQGLDGVTDGSTGAFSSASATFTNADIGKRIEIYGAALPQWGNGTANHGDAVGSLHSATITAINSSTSVTMSVSTGVALSGAQWRIGTVDGIWQPPSAVSQDSMWTFNQVVAKNHSGHAYANGIFQRANSFEKFYAWQSLCQGIYFGSTDNRLHDCMTAFCGEDGIYANASSNHIERVDSFNNNGNGIFLSAYAQFSAVINCSLDNNDKNGILNFAKCTPMHSITMSSNSQCSSGLYCDISTAVRYIGGVTNQNQPGVTIVGCVFNLNTLTPGFKPAYGIYSVGPYNISGTGAQFDSTTSPWTVNSIPSGSNVTSIHQTSFGVVGGTTMYFLGNNVLNTSAAGGLKIGSATTDFLGFYGATPVAQATPSGNTHTVAIGSTTNVFTNTTFDGGTGSTSYTVGDIIAILKGLGILKS